jgi:hypothetical protein
VLTLGVPVLLAALAAGVRFCFVGLPSAMSSARCRFGGDGITGLL